MKNTVEMRGCYEWSTYKEYSRNKVVFMSGAHL